MMNILGTGLSGLIGSRVVELLSSEVNFNNISLETGVDITDYLAVEKHLKQNDGRWVWHFAAATDVAAAEKERSQAQESVSWKVNVEATRNIAQICQQLGKHLLYLSTDYVFRGTQEFYTEREEPNPEGWYATTKYEGEKIVLALGELGLVVRLSNPYRANPVGKRDFVHKMMDRFASGQPIAAPSDSRFNPTFVDDLTYVLKTLVETNASGVYHAGGGGGLSQYEAAMAICDTFGYKRELVSPTTFVQFIEGRAPFPKLAILANGKIEKLGLRMRTFSEGLVEVKRQEKRIAQSLA